jgi:hypothetical protein
MDTISLVSSLLGLQTGNLQTQIATSLIKSDADAEKSAVEALLGIQGSSPANLGPGIGGNLDISA